jgi:hypothetical protein
MLNELSFYTFRSISVVVRWMTQSMAALVRISGGGWWGGKRHRRGVTRQGFAFCLMFFVFL